MIEQRKAEHIRINLEENVQFSHLGTGLDEVRFFHQALPELDLDRVNTTVDLLGKTLQAPIVISSMTGGTEKAQEINLNLAIAAQSTGIAMGLGSQRAAIEDRDLLSTFQVRDVAPDILLFANLGAIQLNYGYGIAECQQAVDMIDADALILHLNPLQEAIQPEGDRDWTGLLAKIENVCRKISVPVIAKEVGWGFSGSVARDLANAGVSILDIAGAGGTSWSKVEAYRAPTAQHARIASAFADWGLSTLESLILVRKNVPTIPVIASGGLRSGLDIAKVLALGATMAGVAGPFLQAAVESSDKVIELVNEFVSVLRIAMFATGAGNLCQLGKTPVLVPDSILALQTKNPIEISK